MEKLSISSLRKIDGVTELYAEAINFAFVSGKQTGAFFFGVPGHDRYSSSKIRFSVLARDNQGLTLGWQDKKTGAPRSVSVVFADHISRRGGDTTTTPTTPAPAPKVVKVEETTTPAPAPTTAPAGGLEALLGSYVAQQSAAAVNAARAEISAQYAAKVEQLERENAQLKEQPSGTVINITLAGETKTVQTEKVLPDCFGRIVRRLAAGKNVFLYGPAGSGKNVIAEEAAKALGANFYYFNTLVTKFDLTGYCDAQGNYVPTPLYKAVKNAQEGGKSVVLLDEICTGAPEALVAINAALANGYFTFADSPEQISLDNVMFIAADNTNGQGATEQYNGRYKMDESTRDRFTFVRLDYQPEIEKAICGENTAVLDFLRDVRQSANGLQLPLICGYRAYKAFIEEEAAGESAAVIVDECLLKGMNIDDTKELYSHLLNKANKYAVALKKLANV